MAEKKTVSPRPLTVSSANTSTDPPHLASVPPQSTVTSTKNEGKHVWVWGRDDLTSLPTALITLSFRPDRRQHSLHLLRDETLQHERTPAMQLTETFNLSTLVESGVISGAMASAVARGDRSAGLYIARVMDQRVILTDVTIYAGGDSRDVCCG